MVIGNLTSSVSQGYGSVRLANQGREAAPRDAAQRDVVQAQELNENKERGPVTLDAQLDPKTPNEYSVAAAPSSIPPPERTSDAKSLDKRTSQNTDPASRAFLSVANYSPPAHRIDVRV